MQAKRLQVSVSGELLVKRRQSYLNYTIYSNSMDGIFGLGIFKFWREYLFALSGLRRSGNCVEGQDFTGNPPL